MDFDTLVDDLPVPFDDELMLEELELAHNGINHPSKKNNDSSSKDCRGSLNGSSHSNVISNASHFDAIYLNTKENHKNVLGVGSFGSVIRCVRRADGRDVVVKKIDIDVRGNCAREVEALSCLSHPYIVRIYESFVEIDIFYICMEYCSGGDLKQMIDNRRARMHNGRWMYFNESEVLLMFSQLCLATDYVHDKGIIHRDIKSSNVFLCHNGTIKLGDFGIATFVGNSKSGSVKGKDNAKTAIGTPYYFAPEMCQGAPYGRKADMWSLGCLLYEMSTFSHAFEAHCLVSILMKIIRGKYDITKIEKIYSSSSSSGSDTLKQTKEESNFDQISSNIEHSGSPSNDQEFTKTVFYDNLDSRYNVSPAPGTSNFATIPPVPTHLSVISRLVRDLLQLDPLNRMSAKAVCEREELHEYLIMNRNMIMKSDDNEKCKGTAEEIRNAALKNQFEELGIDNGTVPSLGVNINSSHTHSSSNGENSSSNSSSCSHSDGSNEISLDAGQLRRTQSLPTPTTIAAITESTSVTSASTKRNIEALEKRYSFLRSTCDSKLGTNTFRKCKQVVHARIASSKDTFEILSPHASFFPQIPKYIFPQPLQESTNDPQQYNDSNNNNNNNHFSCYSRVEQLVLQAGGMSLMRMLVACCMLEDDLNKSSSNSVYTTTTTSDEKQEVEEEEYRK